MTITIFVEQHPNEDMRTIHLSKPVTARAYSKYDAKGEPKKVKMLERALESRVEIGSYIGGGMVDRKEIRIERNKAFTWESCLSAAVDVLRKFYKEDIEMFVGERDPRWDIPRKDDDWGY